VVAAPRPPGLERELGPPGRVKKPTFAALENALRLRRPNVRSVAREAGRRGVGEGKNAALKSGPRTGENAAVIRPPPSAARLPHCTRPGSVWWGMGESLSWLISLSPGGEWVFSVPAGGCVGACRSFRGLDYYDPPWIEPGPGG
jgi:hypothetical protein